MRSSLTFLVRLVLGFATLFPMLAKAGERVGDVEVAVQPVPNKDNRNGDIIGTHHGYVEYRVQLKNFSTKDQIVHLSYPGNHEYSRLVTRTICVTGGQSVLVSLYQPPIAIFQTTLEVHVEGVKDKKNLPVTNLFDVIVNHNHNNSKQPVVLFSRSVPQEFRDIAQPKTPASTTTGQSPGAAVLSSPSGPPQAPFAFLRSELPVSQWSPNWLGYSCYDAIVVTEQEAEEMPAQVQLAIRRYVECGGTLLIHGRKIPAVFSDGKEGVLVGFGRVMASLDGGGKATATKPSKDSWFGRLAASFERLNVSNNDKNAWNATYKKLTDAPTHIYMPTEKPNVLYHLLVAETSVPVRGLFGLVLLFAIGIGPVNLGLLTWYKRRIWLWWSVPLVSFVTCLFVFAYALASEGITGHGQNASLTLLDERCHHAATLGYLSYYCPLTPSEGPHFSVDTDVALLSNTALQPWQRYSQEEGSLFVDWTSDQYLASGWVKARIPAYFQVRKNEDRRERLTIEKQTDGSLKVVNALGVKIERLYLADASGRVFEGRNISAGAASTLSATSVKLSPTKGLSLLRTQFCSTWLDGFHTWANSTSPGEMLSPGCYIAFLERSPFLESPLAGVQSEDTVAIVYGISKGQK
jgi:hypothetical protein